MATTIGRRRFIGLVVVSVATWPLAVRAQQQALPVIGFLGYGSAELGAARVRSFRQGLLAEAGIIEGRDATIEYRWAEYQTNDCPSWPASWSAVGSTS
jgi:putative ABC transport system substrate-binding protein